MTVYRAENIAYIDLLKAGKKEATECSAPIDVGALASAATQKQAYLDSLAQAKGKGRWQ